MTEQLDVFGGEGPIAPVSRAAPLSPAQHDVMRLAARPEGVKPSDAGLMLHRYRNGGGGCRPGMKPGSQAGTDWRGTRSVACCPWMASDGWDLLKRLKARGLVEQRPDVRGAPYHAVGA